jgi:hypothetical protein
VHDPENEEDTIINDDVVQHSVVADTHAIKRVAGTLDRPNRLSADSARCCDVTGESSQRASQAQPNLRHEPPKLASRRR